MKRLIHSVIHPEPPPSAVRDEARRVDDLLRQTRAEHVEALRRADTAFRDMVRIAQHFIEEERRQ